MESRYVLPCALQLRLNEMDFLLLMCAFPLETLAALFSAMKLPATSESDTSIASSGQLQDDSFFDADEDEFFDAKSTYSTSDDARTSHDVGERAEQKSQRMPFELEFTLSKLRVHFNKDSRHRRLLIVDMDRTCIHRTTSTSGTSFTTASIGNLTFSDADFLHDKTLYREILGLKTDVGSELEDVSSLLEMELRVNPRVRSFVDNSEGENEREDTTVEIDLVQRKASGYDTSVKATFSPMRFVYMQQLWFEIIDYFFEGIVGYEVWGNSRPVLGSNRASSLDAPHAESISFTKFVSHEVLLRFVLATQAHSCFQNITMTSPTILIPVSYCSTDYLRLHASSISFANVHDYAEMRLEGRDASTPRLQWFNNCTVDLLDLHLFHCSGRELSRESISAAMSVNWPIGPNAVLNLPKWSIVCRIDEMLLTLLQEDYALIQHIVQHNIGEESRHLEEWDALQNLPPLVLQRYKVRGLFAGIGIRFRRDLCLLCLVIGQGGRPGAIWVRQEGRTSDDICCRGRATSPQLPSRDIKHVVRRDGAL